MIENDNELKPVPGFAKYFVTRDGRIYSTKGRLLRELSQHIVHGYAMVKANGGHLRVHVAVLLAFVSSRPTPEHEGSFIDGNPANLELSNLTWATRQTIVNGELRRGTHHRLTREDLIQLKLTVEQVKVIKQRRGAGEVYRTIASDFGVTIGTIAHVTTGRTWSDVTVSSTSQLLSGATEHPSVAGSRRGRGCADSEPPPTVDRPAPHVFCRQVSGGGDTGTAKRLNAAETRQRTAARAG